MEKTTKIIIFGGGTLGRRLCKIIRESRNNVEIVAVVDSNSELWGAKCYGHVISSPDHVFLDRSIRVCIAVASEKNVREIRETLAKKYDYCLENIIDYVPFLIELWEKNGQQAMPKELPKRGDKTVRVIYDLHQGIMLGGGEEWTRSICSSLQERGWNNISICANEDRYRNRELPSEWAKLSAMIECIGNDPSAPLIVEPAKNTLEFFAEKMPCVIVTSYLETLCVASILKRRYPDRVRIITVIHSGTPDIYKNYACFQEDVDKFVGVSQTIQQAMMEHGVSKTQIDLMNIPFPCEEELDRSYTEDSGRPLRIGYAGRLQIAAKRMDLLLELVKELKDRKVDVRLQIAGSGEYEEKMREFVVERHLEHQVHFLGRVPRESMPAFWLQQDICINISDFEGRCISITEAMGNGAVPIVTDVSGVRDDITDGVNGFIVSVGDVQAMADQIEYMAEHRNSLRPMGIAAHDKVYPKSLKEPHVWFWEDTLQKMIASLNG